MMIELHGRAVAVLKAIDEAGGEMRLAQITEHFKATTEPEQAAAVRRIVRLLRGHFVVPLVRYEPAAEPPHDLDDETVISITEDGRIELVAHDQPADS